MAGDHAGARQLAETTLRITTDPDEAAELRWLAAVACEGLGDGAGRTTHLAALSTSGHPLAPYASLQLAESVLATDPARAVHLTASLRGDWGGAWTARMTEARALVALGRNDEAIARCRAIVAATPDDVAAISAGMPLVSLLAAR
ncbi:MAG: hypothetical protein IPG17_02775 [Sandaracinaceae bacterium]|nr:hypothetical protein [Sandaracinaceae bacterium]